MCKRIAEIIRQRDETGALTKEQAERCIEDAKKQRDDTVQAAKDTRDQAVQEITSMNSDISKDVNTTTGNVKSEWDKIKDWWDNWHPIKRFLKFSPNIQMMGKSLMETGQGTHTLKVV